MKYTVQRKPKSIVELTIQFTEKDYSKADGITVKYFNEQIKHPGFRKGAIPKKVIIDKVGEEQFLAELKHILVNISYNEIVKLEKLEPIGQPVMKSEDQNMVILEVPVYPEVEINKIDKLSVKRNKVGVKKEEVEKMIKEIIKENPSYSEVSRGAKTGDRVEIDFEGFDKDGNPISGAKSTNHPLILGSKTFIPGFEDNVIGLKKGDNKEFTIKFPENYGANHLANQNVKFKIAVKRVEEAKNRELNDEFAAEITQGQAKTVKALKDLVELRLKEKAEYDNEQKFREDVVGEFNKLIKTDIPDNIIESEADHLKEHFIQDLNSKGYSLDKYLETAKKKEDELMKDFRSQAEKRLKLNFGLRQLIEQEKLYLSSKEETELLKDIDKNAKKEQILNEGQFNKALNYLYKIADSSDKVS